MRPHAPPEDRVCRHSPTRAPRASTSSLPRVTPPGRHVNPRHASTTSALGLTVDFDQR